ncbi:hypothetical protein, partial [Bacillus sp. CGMCC 1.16541]|uniref:hypothetical protein n=1 Tax=Bacillus sp. CGMCC 1.16541 TaxID=2185143 RepID=UPI000D73A7BE
RASRIPEILVFGMFGLATFQHLPNFGKQGGKGGDFFEWSFSKKYYPALAWRKAIIEIGCTSGDGKEREDNVEKNL